jgi:hypothetical protein
MPDDLAQKVVALAARSAIREAQHSSRLRRDSDECGFTQFFRDFKAVFGDGTRIVWFRGRDGSYGRPHAPGVPFSDPPPLALKRGKR